MDKRFLICFDWDGTLADSMDLCIRQLELTVERMGLEPRSVAEMRACNGPTYEQSVDVMHIPQDRAEEFLKLRRIAEMEVIPTCQKLFPGIPDMLERLSRVADLAIVSNGLHEYLMTSVHLMQVQQYFRAIEPLKGARSKTDALAEVLEKFGHPAAVMVGDRLGDLQAGSGNHIPTVAVRYGYGNESEWQAADHTVGTVAELEALLSEMAGICK